MIKKIKPQKFDDLIKISGILHGTGIWTDNGEELFDAGIDFSKLPAFRDDIMLALMKYGVGRKKSVYDFRKSAERERLKRMGV